MLPDQGDPRSVTRRGQRKRVRLRSERACTREEQWGNPAPDVHRTQWSSRLDAKDGVPIGNLGQLIERGIGWDSKELTSFEFR